MKHSFLKELSQTLLARARQLLHLFASWTTTVPWAVLLFCFVFAGLALSYTARHLNFVTGRNDLTSTDKRYVQLDEEYAKEFTGIDQIVVVVEPQDVQQGKDFVTRLAGVLERDTDHVAEVFYRLDTSSLEGKKLLYLSAENLRSLREHLEERRDLLHDLTNAPGLNTLVHVINQQVSTGVVSHSVTDFLGVGSLAESTDEKEPVDLSFLQALLQEFRNALTANDYYYHSPWADFFGETDELSNNNYLISENHRFVFLMVEPKESSGEFDSTAASIAAIRRAVGALKPEFPGLDAGVTGTKALDNDESVSTQADAGVATIVSLVGFILLYLLFFKKIRHPLSIVASLFMGLAWTMGFVTLTVGHLTVITIFVAPMLLGLADDFGVHFIARYEEEREQGVSPVAALSTVFEHTVPAITAGALTTALAFAAVMLSDFRGMQELGFIAAGGMILSLFAMVTCLPALVMVVEVRRPWIATEEKRTLLTGLFATWGSIMERARWPLLTVAGLCTLGGLVALPTLSFDHNLLNLQAHGTESVEWEKRMIDNSARSSRNALATAPTPEEAMHKAAAFAALSSVEAVESVASLIPLQQEARIELVRALQPVLNNLPPTLAAPAPVDVPDLLRTLDKLKLKIREENDEWDPQKKPSAQELAEIRRSLLTVMTRLQALPEATAVAMLERLQEALFQDFQEKWSLLRNNLNPPGLITLVDIPRQFKARFANAYGNKFLLQIYPKKNVWEKEAQEEFIQQLRQIDPDVTGSPVIVYESIRAMKDGYIEGGVYAFIAIVIVTFCALRRVRDTVLAMLPLGLGIVWTAGFMWLFNLQFNLANLVAVPLLIGIGVENGIHIVHRFREEREDGPALVTGSTGQAVALFSLTTMIGFGSLLVARYYGIFSMGLLLTVAVGNVLVASLTVLPLLLFRPAAMKTGTRQVAPERAEEKAVQQIVQRRAVWRD